MPRPPARLLSLGLLALAFALALPAGASAALHLAPAGSAGVDALPIATVTADFNGDGKPDIATANFTGGTVSVLLDQTPDGAATATFGALASPAFSLPTGLVASDFNGDGLPDLATISGGSVEVRLNTTPLPALPTDPATFAGADTYPVDGSDPTANATAVTTVLDPASGYYDLAVTDGQNNQVTVLYNDGSGAFSDGSAIATTGANPVGIATGTLSSASPFAGGGPGFVTADADSSTVSVFALAACGCGVTPPTQTLNLAGPPHAVALADVTGDGVLDVVVTFGAASVQVFRGAGNGAFAPMQTYTLPGPGFGFATGRLTGSTAIDVLAAQAGSVVPLLNNGTGGLTVQAPVSVANDVVSPAIADFNGDGANDVVGVNPTTAQLNWLFSAPVVQAYGLNFGQTNTGAAGPTLPVTFTNTGVAPLTVPTGALAIAGANAADFAVAQDACSGQTVAPGTTCTALVSFTPGAVGARSARLTLTPSNTAAVDAPLAGTGVSPAVGPPGPAGPTGPSGPAGPAGPAGADGRDGTTGAAGPAGATGATGVPGANGADGVAGPTGPAGPQGLPGRSVVTKVPKTCTLVRGTRFIHCVIAVDARPGCRVQAALLRGGHVAAVSPSLTCRRQTVGLRWSGRRAPTRGAYTLVITTKDTGRLPIPVAVPANLK